MPRLRRMPLPGLSVWEIKRAKDARCRGGRLCPPDEQLQICAAPLMLHWRGSAPWLPLREAGCGAKRSRLMRDAGSRVLLEIFRNLQLLPDPHPALLATFPGRQCHQLKTIDGLFYAKTVEMQPQLVGAGLCSARQNAVNSFENLRRIRKQLPLWM